MANRYAANYSKRETPQSEKIPGSSQVANSAGGYSFPVDDWKRLERFLILGSEGGSYYASARKLTVENAEAVVRCIQADPKRTVDTIVDISDRGRAPKNDPAIFALALMAAQPKENQAARRLAYMALPKVCRIGTHLFQFVAAAKAQVGYGRGLRNAIARWYMRSPDQLAEQLAKYQQRDGWSHRDLLRLSHAKPVTPAQALCFKWAAGKVEWDKETATFPRVIEGFQRAQNFKDAKPGEAARIVRDYKLPRECVPTEWLTSPEVWEALLEDMPMTAMIRNLANMTRCGLIAPLSEAAKTVAQRLAESERLKRARVHPMGVLIAAHTYSAGRGVRGSNTWSPVQSVVDALDEAFYLAFDNVEPTEKRHYLGIDISSSMWGNMVMGIPGFNAAIAAGAMAMVTVKSERDVCCAGFTRKGAGGYGGLWGGESGMTPIPLSRKQRLDGVLKEMRALEPRMGGTDCALPMTDALEKGLKVDTFVVYTDNETWAGAIHPAQALRKYRAATGIPAKLVVVGMVSNGFTIADPEDAGMMDVVGFDASAPQVMANFSRE